MNPKHRTLFELMSPVILEIQKEGGRRVQYVPVEPEKVPSKIKKLIVDAPRGSHPVLREPTTRKQDWQHYWDYILRY